MPHDNNHPDGFFEATITSHCFTVNSNGKDRITFHVRTEFEMPGGMQEEGHLRGDLYLTEAAAPYTAKKLRAMGFRGASFGELEDDSLAGNRVRVQVKVQGDRGQYREVDIVTQRGDEDAKQRARRFDKFLRGGSSAPSNRRASPPPPPADEVPF